MLHALAASNAVENRVLFVLMTFWNDHTNGLAHGLTFRVAEHSLRGGIPRRDDAIEVFADDGIIGRFHNRREARTVPFRVLPRRDVARDLRDTDDRPVVANRRSGDRHVDSSPILVNAHRLEVLNAFTTPQPPNDCVFFGAAIRRDDHKKDVTHRSGSIIGRGSEEIRIEGSRGMPGAAAHAARWDGGWFRR